jgi:hypothetical protein
MSSQPWSYRLAEFAERELGWLSLLVIVAAVAALLSVISS